MSLFFSNTVFGIPVDLAYHLVCWIAALLVPLLGGLATAAAIIAFTVAIRLLLLPLSYFAVRGSVRGEGARARLQPRIAELQRRHARDPQRLQAELGALYRAEGSGMFGGCLPLLLQLPFFSVMYRLFLSRTVEGRPNGLLTRRLLTTPLGSHWLTAPGPASIHGLVFLGLFALLAVVAFLTARSARATTQAGTGPAGQQGAFGALGKVVPYTTLAIAAFVPLAAVIYLLTTTSWTTAERAILRRLAAARRGAEIPPDRSGVQVRPAR